MAGRSSGSFGGLSFYLKVELDLEPAYFCPRQRHGTCHISGKSMAKLDRCRWYLTLLRQHSDVVPTEVAEWTIKTSRFDHFSMVAHGFLRIGLWKPWKASPAPNIPISINLAKSDILNYTSKSVEIPCYISLKEKRRRNNPTPILLRTPDGCTHSDYLMCSARRIRTGMTSLPAS